MKKIWELFRKFGNKSKNFKLIGSGRTLRSDEEMLLIDKEAADNAFKKYKKEILDLFLIQCGFLKYKTNAYVRLNKIGLLEYIDIQKERYGSKTFCINFAIMPLYCPLDYIVIGLGDRLGKYITGKDFWWDYADDDAAKKSFQNVEDAIKYYLLPWFESFSDENNYKQKLLDDSGKFNGYPNRIWLDALNNTNKELIIQENINRLKLPKKINKNMINMV